MRFLIPLALFFVIDIYAFQAFATMSADWSKMARRILYFVYWSIPVVVLGTAIAASFSDMFSWNRQVFTFLRALLVIAYLSKFVIILVLFGGDFFRFFQNQWANFTQKPEHDPSRSKFLATTAVLAGAIPFGTLIYGILRNQYRYQLEKVKIPIKNLPKGLENLRIVQISDIHSGSFTQTEPIRRGIELINAQKPDLVFFTGDLVNSISSEMTPFLDVFDKIEAKYGVFSITGNHDYGDYSRWETREAKLQNFEDFKQIHRRLGWDLLLNEHRQLDINGEKLAIIGVENYSGKANFSRYGDLQKAAAGTENIATKILLSHDPSHWDAQVRPEFSDIQLMLAGHTHGMQFGIDIPGVIKWSPVKWLYEQWSGLYQKSEQFLYVNRGFGFLGYPGRVGMLAEVTLIELVAK
jgi:uncharacterized protein